MQLQDIRLLMAEQQPLVLGSAFTLIFFILTGLVYMLVRRSKSSASSSVKSSDDDSWLEETSSNKKGKKSDNSKKAKQKKSKSAVVSSVSNPEISKSAVVSSTKSRTPDLSENKKTGQQNPSSASKSKAQKKQVGETNASPKQDGPSNISGDWTVAASKKKPKSKKSKKESDVTKNDVNDSSKDDKQDDIDAEVVDSDKAEEIMYVDENDATIEKLIHAVEDYIDEGISNEVEEDNEEKIADLVDSTEQEEEPVEEAENEVLMDSAVAESVAADTTTSNSKSKKKSKKKNKEKTLLSTESVPVTNDKPEKASTAERLNATKSEKVLSPSKGAVVDEREAHTKLMQDVEKIKIPAFQRKLDGLKEKVDYLESEVTIKGTEREIIKPVKQMLVLCTEEMMKELEKLDSLSLSRTSAELANKRKDIVRRIQELLSIADGLETRVASAQAASDAAAVPVKVVVNGPRSTNVKVDNVVVKDLNPVRTDVIDVKQAVGLPPVNLPTNEGQAGVVFDELAAFSKPEPENTKKKKKARKDM